ncbi:MAG: hypothetical protein LBQ44_01845 [Treponema sp.]|jgi:hypothetical protein|nr:hypothetical protein [Treponema sp.]
MNWGVFFSAAAFLLWFFSLLYIKSYVRKSTSPEAILARLSDEIRRLEADIDEKTEQNLQLLEERITNLRELTAEAERRIALYTRELNRGSAGESSFAALSRVNPLTEKEPHGQAAAPITAGPEPEKKPGPKKKTARRKKTPPYKTSPGLLDTLELRDSSPETASYAASPPPGKSNTAQGPENAPAAKNIKGPHFVISDKPVNLKRPLRERVAEFHRAGFSADMIAVRLGLTVAETKLYLALDTPEKQ